MKTVISNSKLNCYGSRVLTEGIDLTQYRKNPILLWMHKRPWRGSTDEILPIGFVKNIAIEGDNLVGELVLDEKDEFAVKIKSKLEQGILKMVSPGLDIIELSEDPEKLLPGQTRATITKSKLREVSVVDIGGNDDALLLYSKEGKVLELSDSSPNIELPFINNKQTQTNMTKIALFLGLASDASEEQILTKIKLLQADADNGVKLAAELKDQQTKAISSAVEMALSLGKITADKKDHFIKLGAAVGVESLNETLNLLQSPQRPSVLIKPDNGLSGSTPDGYTKLADIPAEKLELYRKENAAAYAKLYKAEFGIDLPQ